MDDTMMQDKEQDYYEEQERSTDSSTGLTMNPTPSPINFSFLPPEKPKQQQFPDYKDEVERENPEERKKLSMSSKAVEKLKLWSDKNHNETVRHVSERIKKESEGTTRTIIDQIVDSTHSTIANIVSELEVIQSSFTQLSSDITTSYTELSTRVDTLTSSVSQLSSEMSTLIQLVRSKESSPPSTSSAVEKGKFNRPAIPVTPTSFNRIPPRNSHRTHSRISTHRSRERSRSPLRANRGNIQCCFCKSNLHLSKTCTVVTKISIRQSILIGENRCTK
ncbi:hypothetical protein PENTCL1PPCAC_26075 [Pristionchus entomophagus]|uniref:BLOC-1-related complex subunit 5 n=1 Tax=Pristionchus entomophagus TaxID=358040 RepID=A0AAV5UAI5_9BILA|nr:hypothetical protein PENTCL1PPCAC_26075 [Pristionchus entomophagus]